MAKVESKAELDTLKVVIQDKYSSETVSVSPLSLYSSYEKIDIELRPPSTGSTSSGRSSESQVKNSS